MIEKNMITVDNASTVADFDKIIAQAQEGKKRLQEEDYKVGDVLGSDQTGRNVTICQGIRDNTVFTHWSIFCVGPQSYGGAGNIWSYEQPIEQAKKDLKHWGFKKIGTLLSWKP